MEAVIQNIVRALLVIHDPVASAVDRRMAEQYIDSVKHSPDSLQIASQLIQLTQEDPVRHFGFQVLEFAVRERWYALPADQQAYFKRFALDILMQGTRGIFAEAPYIKSKVSTLIVEIAKREWPQRWTDLLPELLRAASMGPTQAELVLLTLRALPEEIIELTAVALEGRRRDIFEGLNSSLNALFGFFSQLLSSQMQVYGSLLGQPSIDPGAQSAAAAARVLLLAGFEALQPFIAWVHLRYVLTPELVGVMCAALRAPDLRMGAAECLLLIASSKSRVGDEQAPALRAIAESVDAACRTASAVPADYAFMKRTVQVLALLGVNHASALRLQPGTALAPDAQQWQGAFLRQMLQLTAHPSLLLASFTMPFWLSFLSDVHALQDPFLAQLPGPLLLALLGKLVRDAELDGTSVAAEYSRLDFDDPGEFAPFYALLRQQTLEVVRLVARGQPALAFQTAAEVFLQALHRDHQSDGRFVTVHTPSFMALDAATALLDAVLAEVPDECYGGAGGPGPLLAPADAVVGDLLRQVPVDPLIGARVLQALQAFWRLFRLRPATVPTLLEKVMSFAGFSSGGLADDAFVRRRACASLTFLAQQMPQTLLPFLGQLVDRVGALAAQQLLHESELAAWTEPLVLLSNEMKNYDQQVLFLRHVLAGALADLGSVALAASLSTAVSFARAIGLLDERPPPDCAAYRRKLHGITLRLHAAAKRCAVPSDDRAVEEGGFGSHIVAGVSFPHRHPFQALLPAVLPPLAQLMRCLHALWEPDVAPALPPVMRPALEVVPEDDPQLGASSDDGSSGGAGAGGDDPLEAGEAVRVRRFLSAVRDTLYRIVGRMAENRDAFYTFPNISALATENMLAHVGAMHPRHLRSLLRLVLGPVLGHCPAGLFPRLVDPLLPPVCTFVGDRLAALWSSIMASATGAAAATSPAAAAARASGAASAGEREEMLHDKWVRELTREFAEFLSSMLLTRGAAGDTVSDLGRHILITSAAAAVVPALLQCLAWPDSMCARRAILTATVVVASGIGDATLYAVLARDLLGAALQALSQHAFHTLHAELLELVRMIVVRLSPQTDEVAQVLARLPGLSTEAVEEFVSAMQSTTDSRRQRKYVRSLLQDVQGLNLASAPRGGTILDLPEKLFVLNATKPRSASLLDGEGDVGLSVLFGSPSKG